MMDTTKPDGVNSSTPPLRVLILEDNPRDAKLIASVLERGGYSMQSEVTDSAEVFRERLEKTDYDVILADFNLRNWTAFDALEILKRSGKDIPLIVVTGTLGDEAAVECLKRGAADFVLKDRPARLPTAVQRALEDKRLRTENKRAFEATSPLATIVESSDDAIIGTTLEGVLTSWNRGAEKLYGYSAGEILGQPISVLVPPERSEEVTQILTRLKRGERLEHFESVRVRKDGSLVDVSLSISPLTGSRGEVTGTASIAHDITERKRAEEALAESQALLNAIVESTSDMIWSVDSESFRLLRFNRSLGDYFLRWCGIRLQIGTGPEDHFPTKDLVNRWRGLYQRALSEGSYSTDYNVSAGSNVLQLTFNLLKRDGKVFGISVFGKNITERKRAEEALQNEKAFTESIIDSLPDSFYVIDSRGRYVRWNKNAGRALGYSNEEFAALDPLTHVAEDERPLAASKMQEALAKGGATADFHLLTKDGRKIPYLLTSTRAVIGGKVYLVGVGVDITERKRAEEMLQDYERVVEGSDEMIAVVDRTYRYLLANRAFLDRHGLKQGDVLGHSIPEVSGQEVFEGLVKKWLDECFQGNVVRYELKHKYHKLGERDIFVSYFPIEGPHGVDRAACVLQDITERKQAEQALIEERHLLHTLMENLPDVIYFKDRESRFTRVNKALAKAFGVSGPSQVVGRTDFDFFTAEHAQEAHNDEQEIINTGQPVVGKEEKETWPDGHVTWASTTKMPLRDAKGNIIGTFGVSRDITERKRAEEALRDSEEKYRVLYQSSSDAIMMTAPPEWKFAAGNLAAMALFGARDERELVAAAPWSLSPEYQPDGELSSVKARQMIDLAMERGSHLFEWTHKKFSGEEFVATVTLTRMIYRGQLFLQGTVRDITERKRAEAEHIRLVTAIEQSAEAVVMTNTEGAIEYVNPAFTRITGYNREEVLGQNPRILKSGKQDPALYQQLWATILNGQTWHGELINRRKDGSLYTEQMNITPVRDALGEVTHFIATKQDVTARKQLERQLIQAQKMEAVGRLAGGVAHDFNNLLTIINGYAQLLIEPISPKDPRRGHLKEILMAGERAASLTRQLLAFSRLQVLEPRVLDLNSVIANIEKMLRRLIGEDVELVSTLKPDLGRVKVDPGQIEQVIMNLAVNARDAMPQGGKLFIETSNVEIDEIYARGHSPMIPGKYVMVAVSDTGCGMDLETQAHIFEPFFTTKGKDRGTGLGLATVYGIVKQSGGFIWVYSAPGRGSTFKIYLPSIEEALPTAEPAEVPAELAKASETVLVVEDEQGVRSLVCETLASHGYKVLEAAGAAQALQIAEQHTEPIHLLLTDVVMPQTSGKGLAKGLLTLHPETKVIYMSGYTDDAIVRHGILEGGTPFLQKPFAPKALLLKMREVLKTKSGTQQ
jgi:PAS domain S-box-containing protein